MADPCEGRVEMAFRPKESFGQKSKIRRSLCRSPLCSAYRSQGVVEKGGSWEALGGLLGASWRLLEPLGSLLGASWRLLGRFGRSCSRFWPLLGHFLALLGDFWTLLGRFWALLGHFGALLGHFGTLLGDLGSISKGFRTDFGGDTQAYAGIPRNT